MAQKQVVQPQMGMKFGLNQEDKKSLMYMYGTAPDYFEKMPSQLASLIVESMKEIENFKSTIPKKYLILALYTQSLVLKDEYKQLLYEKLMKIFGITDDERFFAIEAISFFSTFSIFDRMTSILASKDYYEQNMINAQEYLKKMANKDNHYDSTAQNRTQRPEYGMSIQNEDQCILQFGVIPQSFNNVPRMFADNLWRKWMLMGQIEMPLKMRFLMVATIFGTTSIKTSFEKLSLLQFVKMAMIVGLTEQELIETAAILAFSNETNVWMRSSHYSMEQFAKEVDAAIVVMTETHKINKDA